MKDEQGRHITGRVRWRRFAVLCVPGFTATAALAVALANGALAASFAVSGQQFKVSADQLTGDGFAQYGSVDANARGDLLPVAVTGIRKAKLDNLCQSVVTHLPIIGDISLKLSAGTGGKSVEASDLYMDATQISGDASFNNIEIGRDASTLDKGPDGAQGMQDLFSQQADDVTIKKLRTTAWATTAGTFKLNGLSMKISKGKKECF
ncbi:cholesterol esterase [Streptomyces albus subsp. albus]|nr:cholesterol esterase [Streptomyces albus subsp. albus]